MQGVETRADEYPSLVILDCDACGHTHLPLTAPAPVKYSSKELCTPRLMLVEEARLAFNGRTSRQALTVDGRNSDEPWRRYTPSVYNST